MISPLTQLLNRSVLLSFHVFVNLLTFLLLISCFTALWLGKIVGMISVFLNLLRFAFWPIFLTMWETWVRSLGWEDPLKEEMATYSSTLAWKIPWTEERGGLQSTGSQRVGHNWATSLHFTMISTREYSRSTWKECIFCDVEWNVLNVSSKSISLKVWFNVQNVFNCNVPLLIMSGQ